LLTVDPAVLCVAHYFADHNGVSVVGDTPFGPVRTTKPVFDAVPSDFGVVEIAELATLAADTAGGSAGVVGHGVSFLCSAARYTPHTPLNRKRKRDLRPASTAFQNSGYGVLGDLGSLNGATAQSGSGPTGACR
jgi:hypothetical protein